MKNRELTQAVAGFHHCRPGKTLVDNANRIIASMAVS